MFKTKNVDDVVSKFNKLVTRLEELADKHEDHAVGKEVRKIMLDQEIANHNAQAEKAKTIALRIRNLVAA
jgi:hypothetical protein